MILAFLAGSGLKGTVESLQKMMGGPGGGRGAKGGSAEQQPHRAQGVSIQGSNQPGAQVTPSASGQSMPPGGTPGSSIPPALLMRLLAMMKGGQQPM